MKEPSLLKMVSALKSKPTKDKVKKKKSTTTKRRGGFSANKPKHITTMTQGSRTGTSTIVEIKRD